MRLHIQPIAGPRKIAATYREKVFGFFALTREIHGRMIERGAGVIVNVIGVAGENHRSNYIAGTAGNASLIAFPLTLSSRFPCAECRCFLPFQSGNHLRYPRPSGRRRNAELVSESTG